MEARIYYVVILIDSPNIFIGQKEYLEWKIDVKKLTEHLIGENDELFEAYYYMPRFKKENSAREKFKSVIQNLKLPNGKTFTIRERKKSIKNLFKADAMQIINGGLIDKIVLVSGDSEFLSVVQAGKAAKIKITVASIQESLSHELEKEADEVIILNDLRKEIELANGHEEQLQLFPSEKLRE